MRAERFAERTAANVATARTSVPAPVANDEIVGQSVARKGIGPSVCHGAQRGSQPITRGHFGAPASAAVGPDSISCRGLRTLHHRSAELVRDLVEDVA